MSGRNWTRRSIEELVEAYLRTHVKGSEPVSTGGLVLMKNTVIRDNRQLGGYDPNNYGSIEAGYLNLQSDTADNNLGFTYFSPRTGANANFISIKTSGYSRYTEPSNAAPEQEYVRSGMFYDIDNQREVKFSLITLPRTCTPSRLKKIFVASDDCFTATGSMAVVTTDARNEDYTIQGTGKRIINRKIYYSYNMTGTSLSHVVGSIYTSDEDILLSGSSLQYKLDKYNNAYRNFTGDYIPAGIGDYPWTNIYSDQVIQINGGASSTTTRGYRIFNYAKNYGGGTIDYIENGVTYTRDMNYTTLVAINAGTTLTDADFERYVFAVCRWYLDNRNGAMTMNIDVSANHAIPRVFTGDPTYDEELPIYVGPVTQLLYPDRIFVKYSKQIVYS